MKVIPLELYKLAVFYGIIVMMFGVLLKICAWPPQYYFWVLHNGIKARFKTIMITHSGPGTGLQRQIMWWIIIPPTLVHRVHRNICCIYSSQLSLPSTGKNHYLSFIKSHLLAWQLMTGSDYLIKVTSILALIGLLIKLPDMGTKSTDQLVKLTIHILTIMANSEGAEHFFSLLGIIHTKL